MSEYELDSDQQKRFDEFCKSYEDCVDCRYDELRKPHLGCRAMFLIDELRSEKVDVPVKCEKCPELDMCNIKRPWGSVKFDCLTEREESTET